MKQYSYKEMIVTAASAEDAKRLGNLSRAYMNLLDVITSKHSMTKSDNHVAEKEKSVVIDTKYYIYNKSGKSLGITFNIVLRIKDEKTILSTSTIDYQVKIGKEVITKDSLTGSRITGKNLREELEDVLTFVDSFSKL